MRRQRKAVQGSALVLSVLVLFALLGLALLAMRSSTQSIAGSGNMRMTKQARYVAEVGLYHAMTLLAQEGDNLLRLREADPLSTIEVRSDGLVRILDKDGNQLGQQARPAPDLLDDALGDYAGVVPSYRVRVEGFTRAAPPAGFGAGEGNELFCAMSFTATGFLADDALPEKEALDGVATDTQFAEHRVKAGVVLGPFQSACRSLAGEAVAVVGGEEGGGEVEAGGEEPQ